MGRQPSPKILQSTSKPPAGPSLFFFNVCVCVFFFYTASKSAHLLYFWKCLSGSGRRGYILQPGWIGWTSRGASKGEWGKGVQIREGWTKVTNKFPGDVGHNHRHCDGLTDGHATLTPCFDMYMLTELLPFKKKKKVVEAFQRSHTIATAVAKASAAPE